MYNKSPQKIDHAFTREQSAKTLVEKQAVLWELTRFHPKATA